MTMSYGRITGLIELSFVLAQTDASVSQAKKETEPCFMAIIFTLKFPCKYSSKRNKKLQTISAKNMVNVAVEKQIAVAALGVSHA